MKPLVIGIDIGTSGARAVAMDPASRSSRRRRAKMADAWRRPPRPGRLVARDRGGARRVSRRSIARRVRALAVDGTSGTMLPVDGDGRAAGRRR